MAKGRAGRTGRAGVGAAKGAARAGRRGRRSSLARHETRLAEIITRHVDGLVSAVRQEVRKSVADEVRGFLTGGAGAAALAAGRGRRGGAGVRRRVVPCIAPGCTNPSKGPRFHYLCEKHKDAPKKDYEAWRKAKQEKQAA
jgi:hypothetical protein